MKKLSKKKIALICAVVLTLLASTGATLAYFSDYEVALGEAKVLLSDRTEIQEEVTDKGKTIKLINTSKEGEGADVVVRVAIYGPDEMIVNVGEGWTEKQDDGYYYYNGILKPLSQDGTPKPENMTTEIEALIKDIPTTIDLSDLEIIVVQESAIATYDSAGNLQTPVGWNYTPEVPAVQVNY